MSNQSKTKMKIGTHLIRKGVCTFAMSGSTGGPSIVSVCLRAGWTLGNVLDRYLRYEAAGDCFVGRVVAGLPLDSKNFSILPVHFAVNCNTVRKSVELMFPKQSGKKIASDPGVFFGGVSISPSIFVENSTPKPSFFAATPIITDSELAAQLHALIVDAGVPKSLKTTGIPPHINVYKQLNEAMCTILSFLNKYLMKWS
jgi:hypothetical protein